MKKLLLFFPYLFVMSCIGQVAPQSVPLEKIIDDSIYIELREQDKIAIRNHLRGIYDFNKIDKVFEVNDIYLSRNTCNWDLGEFINDEGVVAYFQIDCKRDQLLDQLIAKYPFLNEPNKEYFEEMGKLYRKKHGSPLSGVEAKTIFDNRKK
ncbi:MAG TPA: hypothetical protein PKC30_04455 [Saprospiraceae bacterium]|nr:hypothetical protein [Saprospiraceae bacterium]